MAKIQMRRFVPSPQEAQDGVQPLSKTEILESLIAYKKQNPVKYAAKKEALFARYGLDLADEPAELKDADDLELEAIKKKVSKK